MKIIRSTKTNVFQSKYKTTCGSCDRVIVVNDDIRRVNGKIVHADCNNQNRLYFKQNRKKPSASFIYEGEEITCYKCHLVIKSGDRVRYGPDNQIHHVLHKQKEITYEICDRCWLTKPCCCE